MEPGNIFETIESTNANFKFTKTRTCRECLHRQRWECGSKIIQYCGIRKSRRTKNGLLKIRAKDKACTLFKEKIQ